MTTKKGAFDPQRLDDELDELLPPVPLKLVPAPAPTPVRAPLKTEPVAAKPVASVGPAAQELGEQEAAQRPAAKPTRAKPIAAGGRQTKAAGNNTTPAPFTVVVAAARLPQDLYEALTAFLSASPERPSYAQLISWTCQDQPAAVVDDLALSAASLARVPRGRVKAAPFALVTPRFLPDEIGAVDAVQQRAAAQLDQPITRTQVICSAIRVAIR